VVKLICTARGGIDDIEQVFQKSSTAEVCHD
jgi:hypothetical protein